MNRVRSRLRSLIVLSLAFLLLPTCSHADDPVLDEVPRALALPPTPLRLACGLSVEEREQVRQAWRTLRGGLRASAGNEVNYPQVIYDLQGMIAATLQMADWCDDIYLLGEFADLYLLAATHLQVDAQGYRIWPRAVVDANGYPVVPRQFIIPLHEEVLDSTQFLTAVAHIYRRLLERPRALRTQPMQVFLDTYQPVLREHLMRWLTGPRAMWTWGPECGLPPGITDQRHAFTFPDYVRRKRNNCSYRWWDPAYSQNHCLRIKSGAPPYCNGILEPELFVAQIAADYVAADDRQTEYPRLTSGERAAAIDYARSVMGLFESRLAPRTVTSAQCPSSTPIYLLDPDGRAQHPEYPTPPWDGDPATAWDLSHARRFVQFLEAMYRNASLTQPAISPTQVWTNFANALACGVWNGNLAQPSFTNFVDGTNTTYRGVEPWGYASSYPGGGYPTLARWSPLLDEVNRRLLTMLDAGEPMSFRWITDGFDQMNFRAALARPSTQPRVHAVPGDFNGDGRADIFIHNESTGASDSGRTALYLTNADGSYHPVLHPWTATWLSPGWVVQGLADFNGDGRTDVHLNNEQAGAPEQCRSALWTTQAGGAQTLISYPTRPGFCSPLWMMRGNADFDGDGRADVLIHNEGIGAPDNGQTALYLSNADGSYRTVVYPWTATFAAPAWVVRGVADFNGDGRADILVHNEAPASPERWRSRLFLTEEGGAHRMVDYPTTPGFATPPWHVRGVADFDGDGRADLFLHNEDPSVPDFGQSLLYLWNVDSSQRIVTSPLDSDIRDAPLVRARGG